ncbi:MAG: hypothetical protein MK132_03150 [Lentisphaerales bacterium]|nr:hypothetical protein [Lentisphaerales bacterium]
MRKARQKMNGEIVPDTMLKTAGATGDVFAGSSIEINSPSHAMLLSFSQKLSFF